MRFSRITAASTLTAAVAFALNATPAEALQSILIYTGVGPDGFYHDSIPTARQALKKWGEEKNAFNATLSNNPADFEQPCWLMQFDAIVFISTAGTALQPEGIKRFRHYIQAGGGFLGVHEATDCLRSVPWYKNVIGSTFNYHPQPQEWVAEVHHRAHPSVRHLNDTWRVSDETYNFVGDPRAIGATVVLTADETSYNDNVESKEQRASEQGSPHPIAWYREGNLLTTSGPNYDNSAPPNRRRSTRRLSRHARGGHFHARHGHSILELASRAPDDVPADGTPSSDASGSSDGLGSGSGAGAGAGAGTGSESGTGQNQTGTDTTPPPPPPPSFDQSTGPGRSFYTALGHGDEQWRDDVFLAHVGGAVRWLLASPTIASNTNASGLPGSAYRGPHPDGGGIDDGTAVGPRLGAGTNFSFAGQYGASAAPAALGSPPTTLAMVGMSTVASLALGLLAMGTLL